MGQVSNILCISLTKIPTKIGHICLSQGIASIASGQSLQAGVEWTWKISPGFDIEKADLYRHRVDS